MADEQQQSSEVQALAKALDEHKHGCKNAREELIEKLEARMAAQEQCMASIEEKLAALEATTGGRGTKTSPTDLPVEGAHKKQPLLQKHHDHSA